MTYDVTNPVYDNAPFYNEQLQVQSSPATPPSPDGSAADPFHSITLPTPSIFKEENITFEEEFTGPFDIDLQKIIDQSGGKSVLAVAWYVIQSDDPNPVGSGVLGTTPVVVSGSGSDGNFYVGQGSEQRAQDDGKLVKWSIKATSPDHIVKINAIVSPN